MEGNNGVKRAREGYEKQFINLLITLKQCRILLKLSFRFILFSVLYAQFINLLITLKH